MENDPLCFPEVLSGKLNYAIPEIYYKEEIYIRFCQKRSAKISQNLNSRECFDRSTRNQIASSDNLKKCDSETVAVRKSTSVGTSQVPVCS